MTLSYHHHNQWHMIILLQSMIILPRMMKFRYDHIEILYTIVHFPQMMKFRYDHIHDCSSRSMIISLHQVRGTHK